MNIINSFVCEFYFIAHRQAFRPLPIPYSLVAYRSNPIGLVLAKNKTEVILMISSKKVEILKLKHIKQ